VRTSVSCSLSDGTKGCGSRTKLDHSGSVQIVYKNLTIAILPPSTARLSSCRKEGMEHMCRNHCASCPMKMQVSGRTCGASCRRRLSRPLAIACVWHFEDSFDGGMIRAHCVPWLLAPFSFLQGGSCFRRDAVCSVIATLFFLVEASVADDAGPPGS
jgi:hypothetical protein